MQDGALVKIAKRAPRRASPSPPSGPAFAGDDARPALVTLRGVSKYYERRPDHSGPRRYRPDVGRVNSWR
jgi:hypothetical protein